MEYTYSSEGRTDIFFINLSPWVLTCLDEQTIAKVHPWLIPTYVLHTNTPTNQSLTHLPITHHEYYMNLWATYNHMYSTLPHNTHPLTHPSTVPTLSHLPHHFSHAYHTNRLLNTHSLNHLLTLPCARRRNHFSAALKFQYKFFFTVPQWLGTNTMAPGCLCNQMPHDIMGIVQRYTVSKKYADSTQSSTYRHWE